MDVSGTGREAGSRVEPEVGCWRRAPWVPRTARKTDMWVPGHIRPEMSLQERTSLEAKMTQLKPFSFGHILRRRGSWKRQTHWGNKAAGKEEAQV